VEKPKDERQLDELRVAAPLQAALGISGAGDRLLASMGIYLFNRQVLVEALDNDKSDFGKHIIPDAIGRRRVFAHVFQGYWEDVGTIKSFFEANLAMCRMPAEFGFFDRESPVYTRARFLPPSKIMECSIRESLIADGCVLLKSRIERSIVGLRSYIGQNCDLRETIIMGCDYYASIPGGAEDDGVSMPHMSIGHDCRITRAIIDKNVHIGNDVVIAGRAELPDSDGTNYYVRDGIVIIPKNAVLPDGARIPG
jgi:glucose-1-phosphate adenylyltransferase